MRDVVVLVGTLDERRLAVTGDGVLYIKFSIVLKASKVIKAKKRFVVIFMPWISMIYVCIYSGVD